jgi:sulfide:quinone oxidoreductase
VSTTLGAARAVGHHRTMSSFAEAGAEPFEVVIAGGGIAALEATLALHALAPGRTRTRLVAPNRSFVDPALSVAAPFGGTEERSWDVAEIARRHGATASVDTVESVDPRARTVRTGSGSELGYDALLLAPGARRVPAIDGALTFGGPDAVGALTHVVREAEAGYVQSIAFAVPAGVTWTLPVYELALMTAAHLARRGIRGRSITVVTPERTPLGVFGRRASETVEALLTDAGVALVTVQPDHAERGRLVLADGEGLPADLVVALPRLDPPRIAAIPHARDGFIPVDAHGRVDGLDSVYAAGDATSYPVKQGGIAAQQADAAAGAIAASAGSPVEARPFEPVLRGALLTGEGVEFLREGATSSTAMWQPPAKIAARYLGAYLAGEPGGALGDVPPVQAGTEGEALGMALDAADADAAWGDFGSALRWLSVAERLAVALPDEYAAKRERWRDAASARSITR